MFENYVHVGNLPHEIITVRSEIYCTPVEIRILVNFISVKEGPPGLGGGSTLH